jgi:hypothetical protein
MRNFKRYNLETKILALVAALAIRKVWRAESPLVIMAGSTAYPAGRREMHRPDRRSHLSSACRACPHRMAARAIHRITRQMLAVAEVDRVAFRPVRNSPEIARLMAGSARPYIAAADLILRRMTSEASLMGRRSGGDRKRLARPHGPMTRRTRCLPPMDTVIERDIETPERRKPFHRVRGMTDVADRTLIVRKLLHMTAGTRRMARHLRCEKSRFPLVTKQTGHPGVLRAPVLKPAKIGLAARSNIIAQWLAAGLPIGTFVRQYRPSASRGENKQNEGK